MKSRILINLVLLIVIIALYYFVNYEPELKPVSKQTLSTLQVSDVTDIVISRLGRDQIHLVKDNKHWQLTQPIKARANDVRVNLILDLLTTPSYAQLKLTSQVNVKQFDLDPVKLSLQLNQQQFQFGGIETLSKHRYVQHNDVIHLLDDKLAPLLNASASSFIDNRLFTNDLQISKIELPSTSSESHNRTNRVTIALSEGHWTADLLGFSSDKLTTLVNAWQHAYAMQVILLSNDEIKQMTGEEVTVNFKNGSSTQLLVQMTDTNVTMVNLKNKLKYQFPISIKQQLFPNKDAS
jgi:hypothetical protein